MTPPPSTKPPLQRLKVDLEKDDEKIAAAVSKSRHIVLDFPLVKDHRAKSAPHGGYSKIGRLFPTAFIVEVLPPFLIVRVRTLPPKPWPLTVGRLPLKLTTSPNEDCFDRSQGGYGLQIFKHINVRKDRDAYHHDLLAEVIGYFQNASIKLRTIAWFYGFWMVSLVDEVDPKLLPSTIGRAIVFYNFNVPELISSGLKKTVPTGTVFDNNCYVVNEDSVLRPGIQLSSSLVNGQNRLTTSGVKVLDKHNNVFITGAAHGFNVDGEVYHPDHNGIHIGDVVTVLDDMDIALIKLKPGLNYENRIFGSTVEGSSPDGVQLTGICNESDITFDDLSMNNPYAGECWGTAVGDGAVVQGSDSKFRPHKWTVFENQSVAASKDGTCGTTIHFDDGTLVGFYRFIDPITHLSLCVSANELLKFDIQLDCSSI